MNGQYNHDLINLYLLKSKYKKTRRDSRRIRDIEFMYPDWGEVYLKILDWLSFRNYVDKVDVSPNLPYQNEYGEVIRYEVGEKFEYRITKKGLSALSKKVFASPLEKEREARTDKWITRIVAVIGALTGIIALIMQIWL